MKLASIITGTLLAVGCGATAPPKELADARSAYQEAKQGVAVEKAPDKLHVAEQALKRAEWLFDEEGDSIETRALAYVALRKAQLATAHAKADAAAQKRQEAYETSRKQTRGELRKTRAQLESERRELAAERAARKAAEKRAQEAMERLKESLARHAATVKEEDRGTVITLPGNVLFRTGKSTLMPPAQRKLDEVAEALKLSDRKIVVEGHTDSRGKATFNQELSEARAQAVLSYLVSRGVSPEDIRAVGLGSSRPVAENNTAEGRAMNRRVEIILGPEKEPV